MDLASVPRTNLLPFLRRGFALFRQFEPKREKEDLSANGGYYSLSHDFRKGVELFFIVGRDLAVHGVFGPAGNSMLGSSFTKLLANSFRSDPAPRDECGRYCASPTLSCDGSERLHPYENPGVDGAFDAFERDSGRATVACKVPLIAAGDDPTLSYATFWFFHAHSARRRRCDCISEERRPHLITGGALIMVQIVIPQPSRSTTLRGTFSKPQRLAQKLVARAPPPSILGILLFQSPQGDDGTQPMPASAEKILKFFQIDVGLLRRFARVLTDPTAQPPLRFGFSLDGITKTTRRATFWADVR